LENEAALRWNVSLDAQPADNSPLADVLYFNPAAAVPGDDISYGGIALAARNGQLTIDSVSDTEQGGTVSIVGDELRYTPPTGFVGTDTLTYTVLDSAGRTATATVSIEVNPSWQNPINPFDVNRDGVVSPLDALIVINFINSFGAINLSAVSTAGHHPVDVSGDLFVSALDALLVVNWLAAQASAADAEGADGVLFAIPPSVVRLRAQPTASATLLSPPPSSLDNSALDNSAYVSVATPTPSADESRIFSQRDEQEDLLETLATDIAPLWNDLL
jgi:hypothetical protein